ncbi:InlB B-repeat-containing protein [Orenia marismortui]|uniref:Peptidase M30-like protein n=1 Tax=Orenia marismortui TaxID=46469 RepID=A0A4R8HQI5_9FIRM|nr:hypothetical protein [Orenia marismortui]TDX58993.1 peptidase M30-like protein [Orenia marismortui]
MRKKGKLFLLLVIMLMLSSACSDDNSIKEFSLEIKLEGQGIVTPTEGIHTYKKGTEVTLRAEGKNGWQFEQWKGSLSGTNSPNTIVIDSDMTIIAKFSKKDYLLKKYRFNQSEDKVVDLGVLNNNEEVIVAITPLNLNPESNEIYSPKLDINYANETKQSLISTTKIQQVANGFSVQALMDTKMRNLEDQFLQERLENKNRKSYIQDINSSYQLGESRDFYDGIYESLTATLEKISDRALIYVEEGYSVSESDLDTIAEEFDNQIYDTDMSYFGRNDGSIYDWDNNGKLIILITDMSDYFTKTAKLNSKTLMGYFFSRDFYSREDKNTSNEADMVYINYQVLEKIKNGEYRMDDLLGTIAHEFQHLIYFIEKYEAGRVGSITLPEDQWINEGFAELAEYLSGYSTIANDTQINEDYFSYPKNESLLYWGGNLSDYGIAKIFTFYLYQRLGADILKEINSSSQDAMTVISKELGEDEDFVDLLLDWMITNQIYDYTGLDSKYTYPTDLRAKPSIEEITASTSIQFVVNPNAVKYFRIKGAGKEVKLNLELLEDTGIVIYK